MNADETATLEFLKEYQGTYVSAAEISRRIGRAKFLKDRLWARPILRRMEMEGILETNTMGDYRIKVHTGKHASFKDALAKPDAQLGDTTLLAFGGAPQEEED